MFTFSYDALSRRTGLTRPNGVNTPYNYDSLSRLVQETRYQRLRRSYVQGFDSYKVLQGREQQKFLTVRR